MKKDAAKRFEQSQEEISNFTLSQCGTCRNNIGVDECKIFGTKPFIYVMDDNECPSKYPE